MLTSVEVIGSQPGISSLSLPLDSNIFSNPFQLKNVDGLGPVKADFTSTRYALFDGEDISNSSLGKRNIILTMGLNPNWATQTLESLRQLLYAYFMPKLAVTLKFHSTHLPDCQISGFVEDMTPNMFSADPEIAISILCGDPDFIAVAETFVTGVVSGGGTLVWNDITYAGTRPTGFILKVSPNVAHPTYTGNMNIRNVWGSIDNSMYVGTPVTVNATYYFEFGSRRGNKYVRRYQNVPLVATSLLNQILFPQPWPLLYPGHNSLLVHADSAGQDWQMRYFARFGGL